MPRAPITIDDAKAFRDYRVDMCTPNYTCDDCERMPMWQTLSDAERDAGWRVETYCNRYARYCASCEASRDYAFLAGVDLERLQTWLQRQHDKHSGLSYAIDIDDLKRSVL